MFDISSIETSVDEIPRPVVELRFAAIVLRVIEAAGIFTGTADDFEQDVPRKIIGAAQKILEDKVAGGPTIPNIAEYSGIPESELRELAYSVTADMRSEYETYAQRIQAEGYKWRKIRALESAHAQMARTSWRDVEITGAEISQSINKIQLSAHERGRNDVGNVLRRIRENPNAIREPIPLPWGWFNDNLKGGLRPGQKLYWVGPPGSRKSTALYNLLLFWGRIGEHVVHFPLDGGAIEFQSIYLHTILWRMKCEEENFMRRKRKEEQIDFYTLIDQGSGKWLNHPYINDVTTFDLLRNQLDFVVPNDAIELFWRAYEELQDLTLHGKHAGRITLVPADECLSKFSLMRQRLESERYDGMTIWSLDNFTKGTGKCFKGLERADELVQVFHSFTDESKIPAVILAHMPSEAIIEIEKRENAFIKYGNSAEEDCDFLFLAHYNKEQPDFLKVSLPKNRGEASGNKEVFTTLSIDRKSGFIKERI